MLSKSQVKYIQSLSQKKFRKESPLFVVEGPKCVAEMLEESPERVEALYTTGTGEPLAIAGGPEPIVITEDDLKKISHLTTPNHVLALIKKPEYDAAQFSPAGKISLFLETIQDPGNMGTIIRLADWFGIEQIVATPDSVDFFHPKVVQSTMGSIMRVNCYEMTTGELVSKAAGVPLLAATLHGTPLREAERPEEGILIIGNESRGISEELVVRATHQLTIPRYGKAESLNAAMATGIILNWIRG